MEQIIKAQDFINEHRAYYTGLDYPMFGALVCMLMEEYCHDNGQDVVKTAYMLADQVKAVNEDYGAYTYYRRENIQPAGGRNRAHHAGGLFQQTTARNHLGGKRHETN